MEDPKKSLTEKLATALEVMAARLETVEKTLSTLSTAFSQEGKLKESDEIAKLKEQVAELSDPAKLREKLMGIAATWTEDEYRQLGEALGFPTARALTAEEEADLAKETAGLSDEPAGPKVFLMIGKEKCIVK